MATTILVALPACALDFSDVEKRAEHMAKDAYHGPDTSLPPAIAGLTYDQYRDIRYRPARNIWRAEHLPFEMAFFHRGHIFAETVIVHEISNGSVTDFHFDPGLFDYGNNKLDTSRLGNMDFAGFRLHYALNRPDYMDEVMTFLGSSYFRALGAGQRYGGSARGLAIDTGLSTGEEFPLFREFWIQRPMAGARKLTLYGLLDSPRACGAYRFVIEPGSDTTVTVNARLYLRDHVGTLGLAPLTSMYFFGSNQRPSSDDYRPQVHDSDGLSIHAANGEWIWRPLVNPTRLLMSSFAVSGLRGFGLMQRERLPDQYQDPEARYDLRPSIWVEPLGSWGAGRIELVEIPTPDETHDNIVAYWVPAGQPAPQLPYDFAYRLHWQKESAEHPPQSWVTRTGRGKAFQLHPDDSIGFTVDFSGPALANLRPDTSIEGVISTDQNATIVSQATFHNDLTGGERLGFRVHRIDDSKPVELRAFLRNGKDTVSETWSYLLPPG